MYAVLESGGKQYRVTSGQTIQVEKIELGLGETLEFDKILMLTDGDSVNLGAPYVAGAKVIASIEEHGRHKKVNILKMKRRKHHMKRQGHRQWFTKIKITEIKAA